MKLQFVSALPVEYTDDLEQLVFFNAQQARAQNVIVEAIERYGSPQIVSAPEGVRVTVSNRSDAQCLFALAPSRGQLALAGMLVYLRTSRTELVVLHIAVADRFSQSNKIGIRVAVGLLREVRAVARNLKGVDRVSMLYLQNRHFTIRIGASRSQPNADAPVADPVIEPALFTSRQS